PLLAVLDIEGTNIEKYSGNEGTSSYVGTYPANEVPTYAFCDNNGKTTLKTVKFPSGLTSIGSNAFSGCSGLTGELTLPSALTSIGSYAFYNCSGLTGELSLPSGLTSIGDYAFSGCSGLTNIRSYAQIPPILSSSIGIKIAFVPKGCKAAYQSAGYWKDLTIIDEEKVYTLHISTPGTLVETLLNAGGRPNSVTSLELTGELNNDDFFLIRDNMPLLHTINMEGLSNVSIPNDAFRYKATLLNIVLPSGLTSIGSDAFYNCSGLTGELILPSGLTSIGSYAFSGCSGLTGELKLPYGLTSIGSSAFSGCSGLTGELKLPYGLTSIGGSAFSYCSGLTTIHIKKNVTSIQGSTFSSCTNVSEIKCDAVTPPTLESYVFDGINTETCELFVPQGSQMNYLLAAQWGAFVNIIEMDQPAESYLVSFVISQGGTVGYNGGNVSNGSKVEIKAGESMNLTFVPQAGYALDEVIFDGEDVTAQVQNNQLVSPAVGKAVTVSVSFKREQYDVYILTVGSGAITAHIVEHNSTHTYRLGAAEGYLIENVMLNGVDVTTGMESGKLTLNDISEDQTIVITSKRDVGTSDIEVSSDKTIRSWKANGQLFVESTEEMSGAEVVDMSGRTACSISKTAYAYVLDLPSSGVYVVRIRTVEGEVKTVKISL
ncbi:MAG: leucine-rich repeat domain-containing protein, partial [Bacteroidales bacterium]